MSNNTNNKNNAAQQANVQPSHYEQGRQSLKDGLLKSAGKSSSLLQSGTPHTRTDAAVHIGRSAAAGAKDYTKAAGHFGKGFMQGVSQQNPNSGQQLNNMKINQAITEGRANANAAKAGSSTNRGISSFQSKAGGQTGGASKSSSSNKGISTFQSRASGQTSGASKSSSGGASKGSSTSSGRSGGSSSGGQSR
jgi:hypothetical protein